MTEELELIRGTVNPFRDVGLAEPDTKLIKADLAAEIIRTLRERNMTGAQAAKLAGITEADISRIRNAQLAHVTIDRLVAVLNRLDRGVEVRVTVKSGAIGHPAPVPGGE